MPRWGESARVRAGLVGAALLLGFLALPLLSGRVYVHDDLSYYFLPLRAFYADCLARGDDPSWCPNLFGGFYLFGEGNGVAHPWVRSLYQILPLDRALNVEILWPYVALFAGFVLLLRRWDVPRDAALFGGILFAFGGYNLLHYIHISVMAMLAHLPWLLLAIDATLRSPSPRARAGARVAVALLTASQLLLGHVQFAWISGLGEVSYAALLAYLVPVCRRRLLGLAVSKTLGVVAAAVQILPLWDAFKGSRRETPTPTFVAMGSLPPLNLIQWLAPYLTVSRVVTPPMPVDGGLIPPAPSMNDWRTHEFALYYGAAVPALLIVLGLGRRELGRVRPLAVFAVTLAVGALVLGFGAFTPLFGLMMKIPIIGGFRVSARYLLLFHLGITVLAALGYARLARLADAGPSCRPTWQQLWLLGLPVAASLVIALTPRLPLPGWLWPSYLSGSYLASTPLMLAGPILVAVGTWLVALAARGWRPALIGLIVLAAADQIAYGAHAMRVNRPIPLARFLQARHLPPGDGSGRVKFNQLFMTWQNPYAMKGLRLVQGYVALMPKRQLDYDRPSNLRVAGVSWVLPTTNERGQPWVAAPAPPLPRVRLVTRAKVSIDPARDLDTIDVATTALTAESLPPLPVAEPGAARLVKDRPGKIDVVAEADSRQLLVIAESYHSGWHARLDGQETAVFRTNGDFLGCLVPAGKHHVQLRFRPTGQRVGAWLSALGLLLAVAVPFAGRRARTVTARGIHQSSHVRAEAPCVSS